MKQKATDACGNEEGCGRVMRNKVTDKQWVRGCELSDMEDTETKCRWTRRWGGILMCFGGMWRKALGVLGERRGCGSALWYVAMDKTIRDMEKRCWYLIQGKGIRSLMEVMVVMQIYLEGRGVRLSVSVVRMDLMWRCGDRLWLSNVKGGPVGVLEQLIYLFASYERVQGKKRSPPKKLANNSVKERNIDCWMKIK